MRSGIGARADNAQLCRQPSASPLPSGAEAYGSGAQCLDDELLEAMLAANEGCLGTGYMFGDGWSA